MLNSLFIDVELQDLLHLKFQLIVLWGNKLVSLLILKNQLLRKNMGKLAIFFLQAVFFIYCNLSINKSLTKRMPFWGTTKIELLKNNIEANLDSTNRQYKLLDKSAKNLLFRMLEKDPLKRITASQALKDDFFRL